MYRWCSVRRQRPRRFFLDDEKGERSRADAGTRAWVAKALRTAAIGRPQTLCAGSAGAIAAWFRCRADRVVQALRAQPIGLAEGLVGVEVLANRVSSAADADAPGDVAEKSSGDTIGELYARGRAATRGLDADPADSAVAVDAALYAAMKRSVTAASGGRDALIIAHTRHAGSGERVAVKRTKAAVSVCHASDMGGRSVVLHPRRIGSRVFVYAAPVVLEAKLPATPKKSAKRESDDGISRRSAGNHGLPASAARASACANPPG